MQGDQARTEEMIVLRRDPGELPIQVDLVGLKSGKERSEQVFA